MRRLTNAEVHSGRRGVVIEKTRSKKKRAVTRRRGPEETEQESLLPRFHTTFVDSICENNADELRAEFVGFSFHARRRKMER